MTPTLWDHKSVILKVLVGKTSGKAVEGGRVSLWRWEDEAAPRVALGSGLMGTQAQGCQGF